MAFDLSKFPEKQFAIYGSFKVHQGEGDEAVIWARKLIAHQEPGTPNYKIAQDAEIPELFHIFEEYEGRAAFERHITSAAFVEFLTQGLFDGEPTTKILFPLTAEK